MAVQFCGSCGQPLVEDQLFCQHCGARNDENVHRAAGGRSDDYATRSAAAQPTDYATRAATPAAQRPNATPGGTMYCGECGFLLTAEDRACRRCGAPVEFPNALIASREISDAPTRSVNRPQSPATPAPPPVNRAGVPWGAQQDVPPSDPQYSQVDIGYDAPTFATQAPYAGRIAAAPRQPPRAPVPPPGGPRRQRWPLVVALILVALVMVVGGVVFLIVSQSNGSTTVGNPTATTPPQVTQSPTLTPSPTVVALTTDTAKALINQFFDDINARNYDAAYDLLSVEYQQNQTRQNFKDGFQTTVQDTIVINSAETLPDGTVEVDVTLTAVDNKNGSQVTTIFGGYYIVTQEGGQLRILRAKLNKQA